MWWSKLLYQEVISLQGSSVFSYFPSPREINYSITDFVPSFCPCKNLETSHDRGACSLSQDRMVVPRGQDRAKGPQAAQRCFPPGLKPPLPSARPVPGPQNRAPQAEVSLAPSGFEPPSLGAPGDPSLPPSSRGAHSACLSQRPLSTRSPVTLGEGPALMPSF